MRCIYSFWSKPFLYNMQKTKALLSHQEVSGNYLLSSYAGFSSLEDFLNSWILSVELSSKHYQDIQLVTDTYGKELLVEQLKLPFTSVTTQLDGISNHVSSRHWSLSKLMAYSVQNDPFVHVDADVYLWKRLPKPLEEAPVFGQNTESNVWNNPHYAEPYYLMHKYLTVLPEDFTYDPGVFHTWDTAISCGIVGGCEWQLIRDLSIKSLEVLSCCENQNGWNAAFKYDYLWGDRAPSHGYISVLEQYGVAKECWKKGIWDDVKFLFNEIHISSDSNALARECYNLGYTHLIGQAKKNLDIMVRLSQRVYLNYPKYLPILSGLVQSAFE